MLGSSETNLVKVVFRSKNNVVERGGTEHLCLVSAFLPPRDTVFKCPSTPDLYLLALLDQFFPYPARPLAHSRDSLGSVLLRVSL